MNERKHPVKRPHMSREQRAKIFMPFNPLKGFQEALREKEREAEERLRPAPDEASDHDLSDFIP